jgi:glutamine amidotransferase
MIIIVDYGSGNLGSIANMLKKLRVACQISSNADEIETADRLILPGVGTFDSGMTGIDERGLRQVLDKKALRDRVPVLGICLGAQLMTRSSEEGRRPGLGWLEAETVRFGVGEGKDRLPLPNIGWRDVEVHPSAAPFQLPDAGEPNRFYFVHEYHFRAAEDITWMSASYGYRFPCALRSGNLLSVQFHPEKSHRFGMSLLSRFAELR